MLLGSSIKLFFLLKEDLKGLRRDIRQAKRHRETFLQKMKDKTFWSFSAVPKMRPFIFLLSKVNGRDFSKVERDESVVEAIRRDPIVVQVLRRTPTKATAVQKNSASAQDVCVVDVCTQTDITFEHIMALAKLRPATPPVPDICPFLLSDRWWKTLIAFFL